MIWKKRTTVTVTGATDYDLSGAVPAAPSSGRQPAVTFEITNTGTGDAYIRLDSETAPTAAKIEPGQRLPYGPIMRAHLADLTLEAEAGAVCLVDPWTNW